jgi:hypothetical protein
MTGRETAAPMTASKAHMWTLTNETRSTVMSVRTRPSSRTATRVRRALAGVFVGVLVAIAGLAACSRTTAGEPSSAGAPAPAADRDAGAYQANGGAATEAAVPPARTDGNQAPTKVRVAERSLIYTGSITIRVEKVVDAADRAVTIATGLGGVIGADRRNLDDGRSEATLVLRVPADKFATALNELSRQLGDEEARSIQTEDVTEAMIDLDTRLTTQRASVERVRALLARARTIGEVVSIEGELTRREAELASLEQRKERLADQVALSTITVSLRGPEAPGEEPKDETGFIAGLKAGWEGFLTSVQVVLTVAGWLLPWVIAAGVPVWFAFWLLRRRPRPATPAVAPATPSTPDNPTG